MAMVNCMTVFKNGMLLVGHRSEDWSEVWYKPIEESVDEDGTAEMQLQSDYRGEPKAREPMEGEVRWLPWFDIDRNDSVKKSERERKQKQFLYDAWRYLSEKDPVNVFDLEQDLDQPHRRKWSVFFNDAMDWKKRQLRRNYIRRNNNETIRNARAAGVPEEELEVDEEVESNDEGYGSERARTHREQRKKTGRPMGPPRPPANRHSSPKAPKRRTSGKDHSGPSKKAKRSGKPTSKGRGKVPAARVDSPAPTDDQGELVMSGGLGDIADRFNANDGFDYLFGANRNAHANEEDFDPSPPDNVLPASSDGDQAQNGSTNDTTENPAPGSKLASVAPDVGNGLQGTGPSGRRLDEPPQDARAESRMDLNDLTNGGLDEQEAINRAIRESQQPDDRNNGGGA